MTTTSIALGICISHTAMMAVTAICARRTTNARAIWFATVCQVRFSPTVATNAAKVMSVDLTRSAVAIATTYNAGMAVKAIHAGRRVIVKMA